MSGEAFPFVGESRRLKHGELIQDEDLAYAVAGTIMGNKDTTPHNSFDYVTLHSLRGLDSSYVSISGTQMLATSHPSFLADTVEIPDTESAVFAVYGYGADIAFSLRSPMGVIYDSLSSTPDSSVLFQAENNMIVFMIDLPDSGSWSMEVVCNSAPGDVWPILFGWQWLDDVKMTAYLAPPIISQGDSIIIYGYLKDNLENPVIDASVEANIYADSIGLTEQIIMEDNGIYPDELESDGIYTAVAFPAVTDSSELAIEIVADGESQSGYIFHKEMSLGAIVLNAWFIPDFECGDVDASGIVNILDITYLINYLYKGGPAPDPIESADVNSSGIVNLLDITYLINYLYKGGPEPDCP